MPGAVRADVTVAGDCTPAAARLRPSVQGDERWRQWQARATGTCAIERTRVHAATAWLSLMFFLLSVGLVVLTFWIEPPL